MRLQPITWDRLAHALVERLLAPGADRGADPAADHDTDRTWLRIALDAAPAARPADLARRLAEELRMRGRAAVVIGTEGFHRPASLRYEHGREDPDSYYDGWLDTGALWREVFAPLDPGGTGLVLPDLWDPVTDRATRSAPVALPPGGVLLLHGPFLLGHWFPFDLTVHLGLSAAALERRTPAAQHWTLPAFARYASEVDPVATADVLVRADDPGRPAWNG
ncbi:uridine kinase [Streptomyces sp. NPDC127068]|uniref:uridine kinase n=1 Tax=Streptomyces sp. NPDC127068 TaxID=3347127 RepID=UPI003664F80C